MKISFSLLSLLAAFCLVGCSSSDDSGNNKNKEELNVAWTNLVGGDVFQISGVAENGQTVYVTITMQPNGNGPNSESYGTFRVDTPATQSGTGGFTYTPIFGTNKAQIGLGIPGTDNPVIRTGLNGSDSNSTKATIVWETKTTGYMIFGEGGVLEYQPFSNRTARFSYTRTTSVNTF